MRKSRAASCSKTILSFSTRRTRWSTWRPAHRPERVERPGALRAEPAVESAHGKRPARHIAQGRRGETGGRHVGESDKFFENVETACEEIARPRKANREQLRLAADAASHENARAGRNCASAAPNWCRTTSRCRFSACARR